MRFRIRYSLGTLLAAMTVAAVALWAIPAWLMYRQRVEFEEAAHTLSAGPEPDLHWVLPAHASRQLSGRSAFFDSGGNAVVGIPVRYDHGLYCIYAHTTESNEETRALELKYAQLLLAALRSGTVLPQPLHWPSRLQAPHWKQVNVYRLDPMPEGYVAKSSRGQAEVLNANDHTPHRRTPIDQYMTDFYEIIAGRERADLGVEFELIHSDPPAAVIPATE